jgi:hypothetical protein
MLRLSFAACALLGMAVRVNAQDTTGIRPGARMRVATSLQVEGRQENFTIVGTLTAFDANRLMIRRTDAAQLDTVPFSLVRHAEVSRGPRPARSSAIRGSIIGGVIGAAAAADRRNDRQSRSSFHPVRRRDRRALRRFASRRSMAARFHPGRTGDAAMSHSMAWSTILATCLVLGGATAVVAQDTTGVRVDSRIRVTTMQSATDSGSRRTVTGTLRAWTASAMLVERPGAARVDTIPFALTRLASVSRGYRSPARSAWRGAWIGAIAGATLWYVLERNRGVQCEPFTDRCDAHGQPLTGTFRIVSGASIPAGILVGGAIGYSRTGEEWMRFRVPGDLTAR